MINCVLQIKDTKKKVNQFFSFPKMAGGTLYPPAAARPCSMPWCKSPAIEVLKSSLTCPFCCIPALVEMIQSCKVGLNCFR